MSTSIFIRQAIIEKLNSSDRLEKIEDRIRKLEKEIRKEVS